MSHSGSGSSHVQKALTMLETRTNCASINVTTRCKRAGRGGAAIAAAAGCMICSSLKNEDSTGFQATAHVPCC